MLSTSLRSVVSLIAEKDRISLLKKQASYLLSYADYTLALLNEKNVIMENHTHNHKYYNQNSWSKFLEKGIEFLKQPRDIIQAPNINPITVNTITDCFAASLYFYNEENGEVLSLVGTTGDITAPHFFDMNDKDIFVVDAFIEPVGDFVFCLHFSLNEKWTSENVTAYVEEIEHAIIKGRENEYFFKYFKLLIGGKL
jgi:hypothetical protein